MIFVTVGSREYPFDRLFKELDILVKEKIIKDEIFAQIGQTTYEPQNFKFERFLDNDTFEHYQSKADLIIAHGGTGALIGALKKEKKVIAVPRLAKYHEHIDDHQLQVAGVLQSEGYLMMVTDISKLGQVYENLQPSPDIKKYDRPSNVLSIIESFIKENS